MKKNAKVIVFLLAVIIMNLPLSFLSNGNAQASSGNIYKYILSTTVANINDENENTLSLDPMNLLSGSAKNILSSCIPAMKMTNGTQTSAQADNTVVDNTDNNNSKITSVPVDVDFNINMTEKELLNTQYHNGNPVVLIYHTHTTESYLTDPASAVYRSKDPTQGVISVGNIVSKILYEEYGIEVLYINTVFDNPYDTAYDKSLAAIQEAISKYPSIKYVFDIHRDGLSASAEHTAIYQTNISGTPAAKIMMVIGTEPAFAAQNIAFAEKVKFNMDVMFPGLSKNTITKPYNYNQQVSPNSVLFEVGSNLSTPDEAKASAVYLGRVIGKIIKETQ